MSQATACAKTDSMKNAQNRQKTAKIGTSSLFSRVTRSPITKFLMFITSTRSHLANKNDFTKKYQKLAEIFSKNLENHGSLVYHSSKNGDVKSPQSC